MNPGGDATKAQAGDNKTWDEGIHKRLHEEVRPPRNARVTNRRRLRWDENPISKRERSCKVAKLETQQTPWKGLVDKERLNRLLVIDIVRFGKKRTNGVSFFKTKGREGGDCAEAL